MKIKNIFFDWSGTLFDDFHASHQSTNATLIRFGASEIDIVTYRNEFILPAVRFYEKMIENPPYNEIEKFYFDHFTDLMPTGTFFKGAVENIKKAHQSGIKLFIFSTVRQDLLDKKIKKYKLTRYFSRVYGDMANKEKTLPGVIKKLRLKKEETLFIGDMEHDITAAKIAGVKSGAFLCGYRPDDILMAESPDFIWNNHNDFKKFIESLKIKPDKKTPREIIPTVGALIFHEGKILLVQTHKWNHTFGIPGGKIKKNETQIKALCREIKEETGLHLKNIRPAMVHDSIRSKEFYRPNQHFLLLNYYAEATSPKVKLNNEAQSHIWITPPLALKLNLNEPTRILVENFLSLR